MKQIFLIIVATLGVLSANAQNGTPIFTFQNAGIGIIPKPSMIDCFYSDPEMQTLSYTPKNPVKMDFVEIKYYVRTSCFITPEENDNYGFNVISIYSDNTKIFELKQPELWTFLYSGPTTMDFSHYTDNRYFIPVYLTDDAVALIFVGMPSGGEMPYLTIIVLYHNKAELVFNKRMGINSITQTMNSFSMEVQSNLVEYDANKQPYSTPITHQIYSQNGLLYYK